MQAKNKKPRVKTTLLSPYERAEWPIIAMEVQQEILDTVKRRFEELNFGSVLHDGHYRKKRSEQKSKEECRNIPKNESPVLSSLKSQVVCGMNRIVKCLEKDELCCVLVCRSSPKVITRILLPLVATRQCPAVAVKRLKSAIGVEGLKIGNLAALGFKKRTSADTDELVQLTDFIIKCSVPVAFMNFGETDKVESEEEVDSSSESDVSSSESDVSTKCIDSIEESKGIKISEPDYSHLYKMREDRKLTATDEFKSKDDFISLGDTSESDDSVKPLNKNQRYMENADNQIYKRANIDNMVQRPNKQRKLNHKKKFVPSKKNKTVAK